MEHLEQLRHSGLFENRVPRYTSYPPASRFVSAEGSVHQRQWLNMVPHGAGLSLYLHIPYCKKLCWFCICRTQAAEKASVIEKYQAVLRREIDLVRAELPDSVTLDRLYIGGGTPTLLGPEWMKTLFGSIYAAFPKGDAFECSVEIDSTHVEDAVIASMIEQGMSRAVVGVQDFAPKVQKIIGRQQSFEQTRETVQRLRKAGLQNLDIELLSGLPLQTTSSLADTAQQVLALDPERISVGEYAHMPSIAKRQIMIDTRGLPAAEDTFLMSQVARQILLTDGYEPVGMDHFVRPGDSLINARDTGRLRRDFQGYSDNSSHALIGLGASAISRFPQGYVQNASATTVYSNAIEASQLAGQKGYGLTDTDLVIAYMIEMLMCRFEINIKDVTSKFPGSLPLVRHAVKNIGAGFAPFVDVNADRMRLRRAAYPLARVISNILDRIGNPETTL